MVELGTLRELNDFFTPLPARPGRCAYLCRLGGYSDDAAAFLDRYYEAASAGGAVIEGGLANPDEAQLSRYTAATAAAGPAFRLDAAFMERALGQWLPRLGAEPRRDLAASLFDCLTALKDSGKNDNVLKNAWVKFLCWLHDEFGPVLVRLGGDNPPKILYEGKIGRYELLLLAALARVGCDALLLRKEGNAPCLAADPADPASQWLQTYTAPGLGPFPADFGIARLRERRREREALGRLRGEDPAIAARTNTWTSGNWLEDMQKGVLLRGAEPGCFYNCFIRVNGVEDRLTYAGDLYRLQRAITEGERRLVIADGAIPPPANDEIEKIRRNPCGDAEALILDLAGNLSPTGVGQEALHRLTRRVFVDLLLEEARQPGMNMGRLGNRAISLLCWFRRYQAALFSGWRMPEIACFIHMGGCGNVREALFLRFLARLPVDVLILKPTLGRQGLLRDPLLHEVTFPHEMAVKRYPREQAGPVMGTAAYQAERDLDALMYRETGLYRNQQYGKASAITLRTTWEEIAILWDQEVKYRPNFAVDGETVHIPVLCAKASGVRNGDAAAYWAGVRKLLTPDTLLMANRPALTRQGAPRTCPAEFLRNNRLQRSRIRAHKDYRYGILRDAMQDHILDKLQVLLEQEDLIRGMGRNGMEYAAVAAALNLDLAIVRMLQRFDFTRKNPKIVFVNPGETVVSPEDAMVFAFLNLVGFDLLLFVPTGYRCIEQHFGRPLFEEHQLGEYLYDLQVPEPRLTTPAENRRFWRNLFNIRGRK